MDDVQPQNPMQLRDKLVERLRAVEAQLAQLDREADTLRSDLQVTDQFIHVWRRTSVVHGPDQPLASSYIQLKHLTSAPSRRPKNPPRDFVVSEALKVIAQRGHPVLRSELYDELQQQGMVLHGKDPVMVFSTMLWRSQDRIVRLPNYGYWPADQTYEPASYYPELDEVLRSASREPEDGVIEDADDDTEVTS